MIGYLNGKQREFRLAKSIDVYPGATVYCRHHSNYTAAIVKHYYPGRDAIVKTRFSSPEACMSLPLDRLFVLERIK